MPHIQVQWAPPASNSAGIVGGVDTFVAAAMEFHAVWFAFIPDGVDVPPDTWTTIPWSAMQSVKTSSAPLAPPVNGGVGNGGGGEAHHS